MRACLLLGLSIGLTPSAFAQEEQADAIPAVPLIQPQQPGQQEATDQSAFARLEAEYDAAYEAWVATIMAMSDEERAAGYPDPPALKYFPRFRALAEEGDVPALAWLLDNIWYSGMEQDELSKFRKSVLTKLAAHPSNPAAVEAVAGALMYDWETPVAEAVALLDGMIAKCKDHDALGSAHFSLAQVLKRDGKPESTKRAVAVLRKLAKDYGDTFYGKFAEGLIYETENLQVGMTAPEFVGQDVHGEEIKLSDYRGQVTFLVFWGFW